MNVLMMRLSINHDLDVARAVFAAVGTVAIYLFGDIGSLMLMLAVLMVADWITGIIAGYVNGTLSSRRGLRGIAIKFLFPFAVIVAHFGDELFQFDRPILAAMVVTFLAANEGLSIIENLSDAGVPVPERLEKALEALRDQKEPDSIDDGSAPQR